MTGGNWQDQQVLRSRTMEGESSHLLQADEPTQQQVEIFHHSTDQLIIEQWTGGQISQLEINIGALVICSLRNQSYNNYIRQLYTDVHEKDHNNVLAICGFCINLTITPNSLFP